MSFCRKYERMISADIDGELSPEEEREMQLHLNSCRRCRTLKVELERMCASIRVMDTIPAPKDLAKKTMVQVRAAHKIQGHPSIPEAMDKGGSWHGRLCRFLHLPVWSSHTGQHEWSGRQRRVATGCHVQ